MIASTRRTFAALMTFAATGLPTASDAAPAEEPTQPRVQVQGDAELQVPPDEATIQLAVMTEDRRSRLAAEANAKKAEAVVAALKRVVGREGDVRTLGYALSPQYHYPKNEQRELTGYIATNTVEVRLRALDRVGEAIDAAIEAGANQVNSLRFGLRDDLEARTEALRQATLRARSKAQAVASALGLEIARVVRLDEGGGAVVVPRQRHEMMAHTARADASTPVEAGTIEVRAAVSLEVELTR